jgi:hypothetical protein
MLNVVIQRGGAHSQTIPLFIDILNRNCIIFFPFGDPVVSYEPFIKTHYGTPFIKTFHEIEGIIANHEDHGHLIFNTAVEALEEWAQPLIESWKGTVIVYNHEFQSLDRQDVTQFFAHPFVDVSLYLNPVSSLFESVAHENETFDGTYTVVIPNWSRMSQLRSKNLPLLATILDAGESRKFTFVMVGMSLDVITAALNSLNRPERIFVKHRLDVEGFGSLLCQPNTYVMPLIHPNGRYASQGLTASIPMALNYSTPLILSKAIARSYEVSSYVDEDEIFALLSEPADKYAARRVDTSVERRRILEIAKRRFYAGCSARQSPVI